MVNESHVQQYGDTSFDEEAIEQFEAYDEKQRSGSSTAVSYSHNGIVLEWYYNKAHSASAYTSYSADWLPSTESVDSRDVVLATLQHRYLASDTLADRAKYTALIETELESRLGADLFFASLIMAVTETDLFLENEQTVIDAFTLGSLPGSAGINFECLKGAYEAVEIGCRRAFTDYSLKYVRALVNICAVFDLRAIRMALQEMCDY